MLQRKKKKKKRKGIHIRWQGWEAEEEGGVFNISDSLLLNVVPEPSLHWVAEWGGCFKLTCGNKSESHCFFVLFGWILCCVRDVISMWVCTYCINNWFTWLLIAHLLEKKQHYYFKHVSLVLHFACWLSFLWSTVMPCCLLNLVH